MQAKFATLLLAAATLLAPAVRAQGESSTLSDMSMVPVASVLGTASAVAGALVIAPAALLAAGGVLVVQSVQASARGTVYVLERASDGAEASIEVASRGVEAVAVTVGTPVAVTLIGAGELLSANGQVLAFVPSPQGQALMIDQRVTW